MSGHSKWATTKRHKAVIDSKRSNIFTKLARLITVAAKTGKSLDLAIEQAKAANMPKENIQRAVDKGTGKLAGEQIEQFVYEAYGPSGIAILIQVITDNKNRFLSNLRSLFNKMGGRIAESGAVSYLFDKKGVIVIDPSKQALSKEDLEMVIIDSEAENYEEDGLITVYTNPKELEQVKKNIEFRAVKVESAKLDMIPKTYIQIPDNKKDQIINFLNMLDEDDDVNEVFTNVQL